MARGFGVAVVGLSATDQMFSSARTAPVLMIIAGGAGAARCCPGCGPDVQHDGAAGEVEHVSQPVDLPPG